MESCVATFPFSFYHYFHFNQYWRVSYGGFRSANNITRPTYFDGLMGRKESAERYWDSQLGAIFAHRTNTSNHIV
jgi:hypothetical protein